MYIVATTNGKVKLFKNDQDMILCGYLTRAFHKEGVSVKKLHVRPDSVIVQTGDIPQPEAVIRSVLDRCAKWLRHTYPNVTRLVPEKKIWNDALFIEEDNESSLKNADAFIENQLSLIPGKGKRASATDNSLMADLIKAFAKERKINPELEDFLTKAEFAIDPAKRIEYAEAALGIDPDNLTAALMVEEARSKEPWINILAKYADLLRDRIARSENPAAMDITPLVKYQHALENSGMIEEAGKVAHEIVNLENNFDYRMQYAVMCASAYCGDKKAALAFFEECGSPDDSEFLLPLAILSYRENDLGEAERYLRHLNNVNPDTTAFFTAWAKGDIRSYEDPHNERRQNGARLFRHVSDFHYLYSDAAPFVSWAESVLA